MTYLLRCDFVRGGELLEDCAMFFCGLLTFEVRDGKGVVLCFDGDGWGLLQKRKTGL